MPHTTKIVYVNNGKYPDRMFYDVWIPLAKEKIPNASYCSYPNIESLFPKLSDPKFDVDYILIDVDELSNFEHGDPIALINTLKILAISTLFIDEDKTKKRTTKILACANSESKISDIKEISKLVDGLQMSMCDKFTMDMLVEDQIKLVSGDLSTPKPIQNMLKRKSKKEKSTEVELTPRQKQVFTMVAKRGATNKVIAKTLKIAESTVKLHMGAILRKYGLRNRTQLAVFANSLET